MPSFPSNGFTIFDPVDQTKQFQFRCDLLGTGTLRLLSVPYNGNGTICIAQFQNNFSALQTFSAGATLQNSADDKALTIHRTGSGYVADLVRTEDHVGSQLSFRLDYLGRIPDSVAMFSNGIDPTKLMGFDLSGISTATTRILTVPNADGTIALTSAIPTGGLAAGVYTPTRSAEANLTGTVVTTEAQYLRVGNTVTVSGRVTGVDPVLTATTTSFEMTLPVASNLGAVEDLAGVAFCGSIAGMGAEVIGSVANNTAVVRWVASDITSQDWSFHFSYAVI